MTRLIDADALKYDFGELYDQEHNRRWWDLYVTNEAIAKQPTIEAIPIKWIIRNRNKHNNDGFAWIFEAVLDDWRKEHDKTN